MATVSAPLTLRSFGYWAFQYKRTWRGSIVSTALFPVLFLASMGLGLGTLVDASRRAASTACPTWCSWRRACSPRRRCRQAPASRPTR